MYRTGLCLIPRMFSMDVDKGFSNNGNIGVNASLLICFFKPKYG